jgi:hypothetical protein
VTAGELKAEIGIEFDSLQQVVNEIETLREDVAGREPTVREKTAAAAFLAQFYSGIENILKRLTSLVNTPRHPVSSWQQSAL